MSTVGYREKLSVLDQKYAKLSAQHDVAVAMYKDLESAVRAACRKARGVPTSRHACRFTPNERLLMELEEVLS